MMATLIIGIDFSARSDRALRRGILLARQHGFDLHLVHVLDGAHTDRRHAAELLSHLQQTAIEVDGVSCDSEVREGEVGEQIRIVAEERSAEVILIGRRRVTSISDRLRRSTAESIYRQSSVPLIVVGAVPARPYEQVLVPTNLSEEVRLGVSLALALTFLKECTANFFHAYDAVAQEMLGRALVPHPERDAYLTAEAARAEADLQEFVRSIGRQDSFSFVRATGGSVASDILRGAADARADLIVMATRSHGILYETVVHNVVMGVLKTRKHDVMVA
jgi:nucleotide-binding universal stress UspA family protein